MLLSIRSRIARWLDPAPPPAPPASFVRETPDQHAWPERVPTVTGHTRAYEDNLYERARTQWQFGEWDSLVGIDHEALRHQPERGRIALMVAAAHLQRDNRTAARQFIGAARAWGCDDAVVNRMLVAGVHNSLARAALIAGQQTRAQAHVENAIGIGTPGTDRRLLTQARVSQQSAQLGLELQSAGARDLLSPPGDANAGAMLRAIADKCMESADIHQAVDGLLAGNTLSRRDRLLLFVELADRFFERKDRLTGVHFLVSARGLIDADTETAHKALLVRKLIAAGKPDLAADLAVEEELLSAGSLALQASERKVLRQAYDQIRAKARARSDHGHDLLLAWLRKHAGNLERGARKPVLIEIGSTRENVPGQGSTRKLATACKELGLHFITVDMDPHNSRMARAMFDELDVAFEAVTDKGEDYLRGYQGQFDCVFLDAYDFDHGGHSELRQSRYRQYLGEEIDDDECHRMHLDCAQSIVAGLAPTGAVCVDDTWLEEGQWTAKGTLAMPYLLAHGFAVQDARNRAALLTRTREQASVPV